MMTGQLIVKECRHTVKSLIYLVYVACVALFFFTQMGNVTFLEAPVKGQESYSEYGSETSHDKTLVMEQTLGALGLETMQEQYMTAPIGFTKYVKPDKKELQKIEQILDEFTGLTEGERQKMEEEYYTTNSNYMPLSLPVKEGVSYKDFSKAMEEIDQMLGGHSNYSKQSLDKGIEVPLTYEGAVESYDTLLTKDRVTGGYARLFCDYMGIVLGLAPLFLIVTRSLRDKRAQMQQLIFSRHVSSLQLILSRYIAVVMMAMAPIIILSLFTLGECIVFANGIEAATVDYFAFFKYIGCWLLPECMVVTALGMLLTEWTQTALAVLVQMVWWFMDISIGVSVIEGGGYGMHLIARHNSKWNYEGFVNGFDVLVRNRVIYAVVACMLVVVTVWIYEQKRKGRLRSDGKIFANWKRKS